ncbi:uncharacterized protein LOC120561109 [Perca fluviatilis]|uniref:uncharacterized protein LOC120561109 n=1 Tax=Perca fluviatilis TaxID=8168 RepID=UPI0019652C02|nr:uncharacterized protein LOC120561109 [Perca fluviatilis]
MAGQMKSWRTLRLLILFSLLILTQQFEVRDEEWEELGPDIAALHHLRGLSEHMFHERLKNPSNHRGTSINGARVERSLSREDIDQNPMSLLSDLQENEKFTASVIQKEQDFEGFLAAIDEQKTQDVLLSASEISHSYSQKLLVMTDKEKSTNDRVQQEYSMDPRYSVIVSNECLFNVSCVPEADSYTLVKIFGSVSEDGQTVSGLSGSSLAELMLKPSLETAPVFSLDGNTTKDFQHNFIRVFTARGIPAVLETNQENHQTYQVMNQLEEVTGYQIPQRPVDHSTQYDHQQILILEDNPAVRTAATYLFEKHPKVSSVYVLDNNQRPVLIRGDSVPLTEESRLVLVGHGRKDNSGEMRLGGYEVQEVSKIIQQTSRDSNKIKTISVVACDVGSDNAFIETLLKDLHETAGIETELHLRDAVLQVSHTGEKITLEITKDGEQWRHKDDSKKVVATLDRNGDVIIRNEPGSKGKEIFTTERNFLGPENRFLVYRDSWPVVPRRFINKNVLGKFTDADKVRIACNQLEAMSWGFFHNKNMPRPEKMKIKNFDLKEYYLPKKIYNKERELQKITNEQELNRILSNCYEIKSGEDIRNVIRHYAKTGEDEVTYLKVNDWILEVNPINLYITPVGKKLDNNGRENEQNVKKCIEDQIGKEKYPDIRKGIIKEMGQNDPKEGYAQYVESIFRGEPTTPRLPLSAGAWYTTYFSASVISESARNFRTFPLILMALDMVKSTDNNIKEKGLKFLWEEHSMARGHNKADCLDRDQFTKCIKSSSIDYSSSSCPLLVDLQEDEAFSSVTEVRGSKFNDDIRGNKEHNVIVPGRGHDFIQGRGGEDWYVITPGQGVKTINNQSPDLALDILFLKEEYENIMCSCEGQSIIILVHGRIDVILQNWFDSKFHQHLQIKTSDGITSGLMTNRSSCDESLMFPVTVDFRNQTPSEYKCFIHNRNNSQIFCSLQGKRKMNGKVMNMKNRDSVKEMYGSSGFDIMVGNSNENLLDPYTGGALMIGGEGKDTYIIKQGYGNNSMIANFAEDQSIDTVSVDMDYLHGSQVTLDSSTEDLEVTITSKGEQLKFILLNYAKSSKHQHLEFQSSDGVNFKLKSLNSTGDVPFIYIEAFKVTLKQLQVDCRLDLNSQRNLSKVQTVQGCPSQSNDILGNDQDNALIGGWKDDALEGGAGDDTLIGGNGDDLLIGGLGDDTLYGEDGNDTMMGNSGRDVFLPGPGADLVDGGPGRDTVVYRGDPDTGKGVYVNLLTGQGRYADAEGDVLKDVEIVIGTIYSDILVSGYESSLLKGSDGNDILVSTGGDYLVGGDGNDIYMLAFNNGSVTVDNCAKDNATDVLYISSQLTLPFDCQLLSDRVLLTSFGLKQTTIKITLQGWISDENECGHLKLGFRDQEVSVDRLLQECQLRQK